MKRSAVRWVIEPDPEDAKATWPGRALACSISCAMVLTPSFGLTTSTSGERDGNAMGSTSFTESKLSFL